MIKLGYKRISSPVAYCALSIKAGTRDESPHLNGLAHLTEHMLFKGTTTRSAKCVNNFLEKLGGELNAYTTKEETVIHATVLKEDLRKAVELIADIVFNPLFPDDEFAKEKEVVIDEILSYKDSPSDMIYDDFDSLIFKGHALENNILGSIKSIGRITIQDMRRYLERYYHVGNMSFSIVADVDYGFCTKLVERYFPSDENSVPMGEIVLAENFEGPLFVRKKKKTHQCHCIVGGRAYNLYDEKRLPFAILINMLGGPAVNSRLNQSLREKYGLAYTVDATYVPYSDTGLYTIYFGTDKKDLDKCISLINKEIRQLIVSELSQYKLLSAKKQLLGQLTISVDNAEAQCLNMGKSLLVYGKCESFDELKLKIEGVTAHDLQVVAEEVFRDNNMVRLVYE